MVDINLIGDDQSQFEGEEEQNEKEEFQESYESDLNEPAPSSYLGSGHIDDSDYTRVLSRGGSKKIVYVLAACSIILLAVVAWFIFQPGKGKKTTYEPPATTFSETETTAFEDTSTAFNFETEPNVIPTSPLSPALRERIVKSYRGINTVSNILNAIPSNINFTMISYSDGKFLLEFLSAGDAEINNVNSQLQQNLYSANVNVLSKENRNIQSRQFRQALVNGNVDINQSPGELNNPQEPIYLSSADLQNQLASICQQAGLTIKQFDAGLEKADGQFMILPIKFKAVGQKSSISAFLQQLINANINISFSKISLIANEVDLSDPNITLLLNIGLYRMI